MKSTEMGKDYCPTCKHLVEAATSINGREIPDPGDLTICMYCGNINKFGKDMALEDAEVSDILNLSPQAQIKLSQAQQLIFQRIANAN